MAAVPHSAPGFGFGRMCLLRKELCAITGENVMKGPRIGKHAFISEGFTLIELLVVIAIIALLLAVIMPALQVAKEQASAAVCMSNNRQLAMIWMLYAEDYDAFIVDGDTGDQADGQAIVNTPDGPVEVRYFVADPQDENGLRSNTSVEDKRRGYERGALWPYMETHEVFHCPQDKRYKKPPLHPLGGLPNTIGGYRSYSMGAPLSKMGYSADITGECFVVISKLNEFVNPSAKIVWLEEADGYGWNHRTWNMYLNTSMWWDPFAIWHNGSSTFAYADGHAERYKWREEETIEMCENQRKVVDVSDNNVDYLWFKRAYIPGKIPPELQ